MNLPDPLALAAQHARPVLVAGLAAGIVLPGLAGRLAQWLPEMVVILLYLGALRLPPKELRMLSRDLPRTIGLLLLGQLGLPLGILGFAWLLDAETTPLVLGLILLTCAPPIVSSPNIAAIMGLSAPTAMQLMVLGSLLLPLTVLPVFWLMPVLGSVEQILGATGRLMLTILLAGGGALLTRRLVLTRPSPRLLMRLDGVSVLALAIFVIALMASVAESITQTPVSFAFWLAVAVTANFGLQFAMLQFGRNPVNGARALVAGNRNLSLFFVALPPVLTDPLLVFLGCYQLPMLLTPILLARAYRQ